MRAGNENRRKRRKRLPSVLAGCRAQQDLFGLVDLGSEVGRAPLVGVQFLHQRAVRPADVLFARRPPARQEFGRPPPRSFCPLTPRARSPPPHRPARAHASRAPGGRDTRPIARGCRRRPRRAGRAASRFRASRATPLVRAGQDRAAHRAGVVIELHLDERRPHPRHLARRLLRALKPSGRSERPPAEQSQPEQARAGSRPRSGREKTEMPPPPPPAMPPAGRNTLARYFGSALAEAVEPPQHQHQHQNAENQRGMAISVAPEA